MHCIRSSSFRFSCMSDDDVHNAAFPSKSINFHHAATVQPATHTCTNTPTRSLTNLGQMSLCTVWTLAKVDSAFGRSIREQIRVRLWARTHAESRKEQMFLLRSSNQHKHTQKPADHRLTHQSTPSFLNMLIKQIYQQVRLLLNKNNGFTLCQN